MDIFLCLHIADRVVKFFFYKSQKYSNSIKEKSVPLSKKNHRFAISTSLVLPTPKDCPCLPESIYTQTDCLGN